MLHTSSNRNLTVSQIFTAWLGSILLFLLLFSSYRAIGRASDFESFRAEYFGKYSSSRDPVFLPILVPLANRPEYFEQIIEALNHAADSLQKTIVIFSQDGRDPEIYALCNKLDKKIARIHVYHTRPWFGIPSLKDNEYATSDNVFTLLKLAFEVIKPEGIIMLESDVLPSRDFYDFFKWMVHCQVEQFEKYEGKENVPFGAFNLQNVFTFNGFRMDSVESDRLMRRVTFPDKFMVWGWAMSKIRWPLVSRDFTAFHNWDYRMDEIRKENNFYCLTPYLSRTRHIGLKGVNFQLKADDPVFKKWMSIYLADDTMEYVGLPQISFNPFQFSDTN